MDGLAEWERGDYVDVVPIKVVQHLTFGDQHCMHQLLDLEVTSLGVELANKVDRPLNFKHVARLLALYHPWRYLPPVWTSRCKGTVM